MTVLTRRNVYRVRFDVSVPFGFDFYKDIDVEGMLFEVFEDTDVAVEASIDVEER